MNVEDFKEKRYSVAEIFKIIKTNSLQIYGIIFFISISVKTIYYREYSINIFAYFDIVDYTLSFLVDNLDFFIAFFGYFIIGYITIRIVEFLKFCLKIYGKPKVLDVMFLLISFGACKFIIDYYYFSKYSWLGFIGPYFMMQSYYRDTGMINKSFGIVKMDVYSIILTSIITFVIFSANNNYKSSRLKANIITDDSNYHVDSKKLIFAGESKNYLFLYDKIKRESLVIKREKVKNMKFYSLQ